MHKKHCDVTITHFLRKLTLPSITGASLGALQMGADEKIYVADKGNTDLHVIHRPNGKGVQCNLKVNDFPLTSSTITGVTSEWGLPNVITDKTISCDRYVYVTPRGRVAFNFDVVINNVNDVIDAKKMSKNFSLTNYFKKQKYTIKHFSVNKGDLDEVFRSLTKTKCCVPLKLKY